MTAAVPSQRAAFLAGGGEMGALMRSLDWSRTPIGPVDSWPATLRTAVSICLSSRFPMLIWWGPELVKLYNDGYRPILGDKHPASMGRPGREVWPEIWDVIGPMLEGVMQRGEATWSDDQLLLMDRSGYLEETYFTFSYSPIPDESGAVAGIFTAVTETTERVLSARRLAAAALLAERTAEASTPRDVARAAVAALAQAAADAPFSLLYLLEDDGAAALAGARGLAAGAPEAPERVEPGDRDAPWSLGDATSGPVERELDGLGLSTLDGTEVDRALALPIARPGAGDRPAGVLVLGVNPRRALDDEYREFFRLVGRLVASALAEPGVEALRWHSDEPAAALEPAGRAQADVLVVDDDADLRDHLSRLLGTRYAVRTATDGVQALEALRERPADLVLTDVTMPRMDGLALLAELRRDPRTRRLPVVMLTARAGEDAAIEGLGAGADDYLVTPFSAAELMARVRANLELTRLRDALAAGERGHVREMEGVALTLQRSLLPRGLPEVVGAELSGRYFPAGHELEVGGDFYDATALGDGRVVVTIGDVAGHGVLAAAVMGQVRQALRAYAAEGHPPAVLMERLDHLVREGGVVMTSCLCAVLDPATGALRFSNAGHPPPLVRRADGTVERLDGALSNPLGASASTRHVDAEAQLGEDDMLLLYTDGLVERRREPIDAGIDDLAATVRAHDTPSALCDRVAERLERQAPEDDVAILALRRTGHADDAMSMTFPAHPARLVEVRRRLRAWLGAQGAAPGEVGDVELAVHEACMNAVEHAYGPGDAEITVEAHVRGDQVEVLVRDHGRWREQRAPHRGRGHSIMSALMDRVDVETAAEGSTVRLRRGLRHGGRA